MGKLQGLWRSAQLQAKRSSELAAKKLEASADDAARAARRNLRRNASHLREALDDVADGARGRVAQLKRSTERQAAEAAQTLHAGVAERAEKLKHATEQRASEATQTLRSGVSGGAQKLRETSASVIESLDPRARARRTRNRLLVLGFAAVAVYGFASAAPDALSRYAIERAKIEEDARRRRSDGGGA